MAEKEGVQNQKGASGQYAEEGHVMGGGGRSLHQLSEHTHGPPAKLGEMYERCGGHASHGREKAKERAPPLPLPPREAIRIGKEEDREVHGGPGWNEIRPPRPRLDDADQPRKDRQGGKAAEEQARVNAAPLLQWGAFTHEEPRYARRCPWSRSPTTSMHRNTPLR